MLEYNLLDVNFEISVVFIFFCLDFIFLVSLKTMCFIMKEHELLHVLVSMV